MHMVDMMEDRDMHQQAVHLGVTDRITPSHGSTEATITLTELVMSLSMAETLSNRSPEQ
jgi:hypothetical protein